MHASTAAASHVDCQTHINSVGSAQLPRHVSMAAEYRFHVSARAWALSLHCTSTCLVSSAITTAIAVVKDAVQYVFQPMLPTVFEAVCPGCVQPLVGYLTGE